MLKREDMMSTNLLGNTEHRGAEFKACTISLMKLPMSHRSINAWP